MAPCGPCRAPPPIVTTCACVCGSSWSACGCVISSIADPDSAVSHAVTPLRPIRRPCAHGRPACLLATDLWNKGGNPLRGRRLLYDARGLVRARRDLCHLLLSTLVALISHAPAIVSVDGSSQSVLEVRTTSLLQYNRNGWIYRQ